MNLLGILALERTCTPAPSGPLPLDTLMDNSGDEKTDLRWLTDHT